MGKTLLSLLLVLFAVNARANVVGVDTQNFNPTNDGLDYVTVQSSKTLNPGLLNIGLFLNYAVNSLPNFTDSKTQSRTNFKDSLLSSDLNFGLGVTRGWEVGLSLPMLLSQTVTSDLNTPGAQFAATGVTEFRLMTKARLLGARPTGGGLAAILSANFNEIEDDPFTGINPGPTLNAELAVDTPLSRSASWAFNAGYRMRHPGAAIPGVAITPLGNEYIASTAYSYFITSHDTKLIAEIFGSYPAQKQQNATDRSASTAEALIGIKTDITRHLAFHFGGGTEIVHGTSSPDWRVYTGINWVLGPIFSKPKPQIVRVAKREPVVQKMEQVTTTSITGPDPFAGTPQPKENFVASDVLFEFDSDAIKPEFIDILKQMVAYLLKPPEFKSLSIEGHTDSIGDAEYNLELSRRRAEMVKKQLIELGLPAERVSSQGYGAARPLASNGNYQGRALNRRVEFKVDRSPAP